MSDIEEDQDLRGEEKEEKKDNDAMEDSDDSDDNDLFGSDDDSEDDTATQAPSTQVPSQFSDDDMESTGVNGSDDKGKEKEDDGLLPDDDLFSDNEEEEEEKASAGDVSSIDKIFTDVVPRPQPGASLMVFEKPKTLEFEQTPFTESRYLEEVDPLSSFEPNVVRWRYRETSEGKIVPETNAHIVRFGDGSMHLFIGRRPVGTFGPRARKAPNSYLYSHSINHLVSIGRMKNSSFFPIAQKGRRVTQRPIEEAKKEKMVKIISTDSEFLKQEDEMTDESRKQREKLLDRQNKHAQRTDFMGHFLEKGAQDSDDEGGVLKPRQYDNSSDEVSEVSSDDEPVNYREAYRERQRKQSSKRKRREVEGSEEEETFLDDEEEEGFIVPREKKKKRRVIVDDEDDDDE